MPEPLTIRKVSGRRGRYTFDPPLTLTLYGSPGAGLYKVAEPRLGLCTFSLTRHGIRAAVGQQIDLLWRRVVLSEVESPLRDRLIARITCRPALALVPDPPPCPVTCLGGQGCRCHEKIVHRAFP